MDERQQQLLAAWRAAPDAEHARALVRALAGGSGGRAVIAEIVPHIARSFAADVPLQLDLARACVDAGDMFMADAVLKQLLQVAPQEPQVWRMLGEVFLRAGNARDADTAFDGAIQRGLHDAATLAWQGKARACRPLQESGGHTAVIAEVSRWISSWTTQAPLEPLDDEAPGSQLTVIREPDAASLAALSSAGDGSLRMLQKGAVAPYQPRVEQDAGPEEYSFADVAADAEPATQKGSVSGDDDLDVTRARSTGAERPAGWASTGAERPAGWASTGAERPAGWPTPTPLPPPGRSEPPTGAMLDEESMDIDVLKLPEGDKLDEVLEALRKSEGLVIEEPTAFYQIPVRAMPEMEPDAEPEPPHAPPGPPQRPAAMRTMMMPTAADLQPEPPQHEGSLRDPRQHEGSLRDPRHHEGSLRDPRHHEGSLRDPRHHEGSLRDPRRAEPPRAAPPGPPKRMEPNATSTLIGGIVPLADQLGVGVPAPVAAPAGPIAQLPPPPKPAPPPPQRAPAPRAVEGPSGVIINPLKAGGLSIENAVAGEPPASMAIAPTVRGDSLVTAAPELPRMAVGPDGPVAYAPAHGGPEAAIAMHRAAALAANAAAPKKKGSGGTIALVLLLLAVIAAGGYYAVVVRGLVHLGGQPAPAAAP